MCEIQKSGVYSGSMISTDSYNIQEMSTKQLADLRAWQTERLEAVTSELRSRVEAEYQNNKNIMSIAKKAGVTRRTVYAWVKE